jgi:fatty acid desaturase (delta-4 desaturase)
MAPSLFSATPLVDISGEHIYSRKEVYASDTLCILEDGVYDLSAFRKFHPGGDMVDFFPGEDATPHFYMLHQYKVLPSVLRTYRVGQVKADTSYKYHSELDLDIKQAVLKVVPQNQWWAPWSWHLKAWVILACVLFSDFHWIWHGPSLLSSVIGGVLYALVGLNIQHDANHGAVSKRPWVNKLYGYSQDWIGGSRLLWIRQHVVGHHVHTNRENYDPDTQAGAALNLSHYTSPRPYMSVQNYYFAPLLHLLGLQWVFGQMHSLLSMNFKGKRIPASLTKERNIAVAFRVLFYLRRFVIPFALHPTVHSIVCMYVWLGVGALYLGFFFILSHIFEGSKGMSEKAANIDWTRQQIESSSTLCGSWLGVSNGGLNYQIEHHLFPRMSHAHYAAISVPVREACARNGVHYTHFPTIASNVVSCFNQLRKMGVARLADKIE